MRPLNHCLRTGRFLYCLALFLIGCTAPDAAPPPDSNELATPDLRPAPTLTATPIPLPTTTPTETPTPLATEAPTALPTLSPVEAKAFVLELTQNNGGCLLPCFWDFAPGQTKWQTAERSLATFAWRIDYRNPDGTFTDAPRSSSFVAWVYLYFPEISSVPISYTFTVQDGIITRIEAQILPTPSLAPSTILSTYGQPDEVWLLTANSAREGVLGFTMTLFYPQLGFMLTYGSEGTIEDGIIRSCFPESAYEMVLATWVPQGELAYAEASSRTFSFGTTEYDRPLEEATGMSLDSFYETFSRPDEPLCLETPADLWPGP